MALENGVIDCTRGFPMSNYHVIHATSDIHLIAFIDHEEFCNYRSDLRRITDLVAHLNDQKENMSMSDKIYKQRVINEWIPLVHDFVRIWGETRVTIDVQDAYNDFCNHVNYDGPHQQWSDRDRIMIYR